MSGEGTSPHVAYRAVLLAAGLLLFGLLFRQLVTLLLALLLTVIIAIPLAAAAGGLERRGVPRPLGALLTLAGAVGTLALLIALLIQPFIDQTNEFVDDVPGIVDDLEGYYADLTGQDASEVGDRVQEFFQNWTDDPERFIGPITSIGLNVAGILAAIVLILITAYYMAVRPQPLVDGLVSLAPPSRRDHVRHVLGREFAIFFAVLTALLVVVPYFGAIAGAIPPTLLALTHSPGKALVVLVAYILVQQVEGNVIVPLVMSQTVRIHPAMIAIGVVVVGQLFGVPGLFVAVPILSLIVISVEEFWVKPIEEADRERRREDLELPAPAEEELAEAEEHPLRPAS